jgi:uncharacterized protein (TIGR02001 family)
VTDRNGTTRSRTRLLFAALAAVLGLSGAAGAEESRAVIGATITSDYILDGLSQTDGRPAFQPYLEVRFPRGFYVGAWMSNVDFGDGTDRIETDLYLGFRGAAGRLSYDLTYYRYYYDETGYCCDEVVARVEAPVHGPLSASAAYHSYLDGDYAVEAGLGLALPQDFLLSGSFKTDGIGETWTLGLSRDLTDALTADLRYHDASYADATIVLSLTWETGWDRLFGRR